MKPVNPPSIMVPFLSNQTALLSRGHIIDEHKIRILVVDDDAVTRKYICKSLEKNGISVMEVSDGESALNSLNIDIPDLILLDIMLPGIDGFEVCRNIRNRGFDTAIIMLSTLGEDKDKIAGLESGADDYMVKPFNPDELLARVRAILRRFYRTLTTTDILSHKNIRIEFRTQRVFKEDKEIYLTPREFALLAAFLQHPGKVLTREELFHWIWGKDHHGSAKSLDVYVRKLREKLENDPSNPAIISTAWGVGYLCK